MAADGSDITGKIFKKTWLHDLLKVYTKSASVHGNWKNTITMSLQKVKRKKPQKWMGNLHGGLFVKCAWGVWETERV